MDILGISAFYHDAAAVLVRDGRVLAAAQEERFTRRKHDESLPVGAIDYCLREGGIAPGDLDHVAFYDKPLLKFGRLLQTWLAVAPRGWSTFVAGLPTWLRRKLHVPRELDRALGKGFDGRYVFAEHHEAHAAAAFFPSPFEEAAILTMDGVGEWATASFGTGRGNRVELSDELRFPHSLGLLYSAFTYYCGFRVNFGEYKLMGLAPYGEPVYAERIRRRLLDLRPDGSFRMDLSYFNFLRGMTMTGRKFNRLLGGPPRRPEGPLEQRYLDAAASVQLVTEEIVLRTARHVRRRTGLSDCALAGGVALNCVANGKMLREGIFDRLWIQPAAGDAGGALGAAMFVWHQLLDNPRTCEPADAQGGSLLGPAYGSVEVRDFLDGVGAVYEHLPDEPTLLDRTAGLIAEGQVVGYFHGRMEFGPRALGNRSILGDARSREMQSLMNRKIKFRESFRPFAPSVLRERAGEWFDLPAESPYMLLVAPVRGFGGASEAGGIAERLGAIDSPIPAVTHVDGSARVQTVDPERHGRYYRLIERFAAKTGCAVIVNTSFNVRGEPIVRTPAEAWQCFLATEMDALVLGDCLLLKKHQSDAHRRRARRYLGELELD